MESRAKTAISVLVAQAAITLIASLIAFIIGDARAALAALVGGAICLLTAALFGFRLFTGKPEFSADRFLRRLIWAEVQKIVLIVVLLAGALSWQKADALPLLLTFSAALMAYWLVLLIRL
jgi:F0F1-type ATP synthase assembly protein I